MKNKKKQKTSRGKMTIAFSSLIMLLILLPMLGFYLSSGKITDYYFYNNQKYFIKVRTDKVFIKTKQKQTKEALANILASYNQVAPVLKANENETMQFVDLKMNNSEKSVTDLVTSLNQNPDIEYSSPVYSPFDGGQDKVLQGLIDEILVQFKPGMTDRSIEDYIKTNGFSVVQELDLTGGASYVLKIPKDKGLLSIECANDVYNSGMVNWAEPNFYFMGLLQSTPNDPFYPRQWSIKNTGNNIPEGITGVAGCDMRVDSAWDISTGVSACIVGMVDTGVDTTHEDIKANILISKGYDFYNNHPLQTDDNNHGTCTGGIVVAIQNNSKGVSGIAPNCKIIPVKIFSSSGGTNSTAITNGLIYSYQQGEWISSNSWGGGSPVSAANQAITDGVTLGRGGKGTVFCFATGNDNSTVSWPANTSNVIAVGGNTPCNTRKSTTSCDGETWWGSNYGTGTSIVAPCVKVYAPDRMGSSGYTPTNYDSTFNGTSSATPNCAGVVALCLSLDSNQRWDSVRVRLCRTADKIGTYSYTSSGPYSVLGNTWNNEMGYGKINAFKLLKLTQQLMGPVINHTPLGNTEQTSGNRTVTCAIIPATSGINPSTVKLYYAKNSTTFSNVTMTNSGGTNWTANLPLSGAGTYNYYLSATDSSSKTGTAPSGAPGSYFSFIASPDTTKPIITHTALPNCPKLSWPATVIANVTDNIGIDSVWVRWKKGVTGVSKQFKLIFVSGSTYQAAFNSTQGEVNVNDTIFYRIVAQDNGSGHNKDSTTLYNFKIISQATACIGNGTVSMGSTGSPFNTYWYGARTNILYTASEIIANQGGAGNIIKIGFQIASVGSPSMTGLNIRMQATTLTSLSAFVSTGWTTVYSGNYTPPGTGWQYIDLTTPFNWNGTSNVLVEICFGNSSFSEATTVYGTTISNMYRTEYHDLTTACAYTGFTSGTNQTSRANTCFVINTSTNLNTASNVIPTTYSLKQNYPNPFNPVTRINFAIPKQSIVNLKVYDVLGREVKSLVNEVKTPGEYSVDFNGTELSSGVYFYKLEANGYSDIKKMMLIK